MRNRRFKISLMLLLIAAQITILAPASIGDDLNGGDGEEFTEELSEKEREALFYSGYVAIKNADNSILVEGLSVHETVKIEIRDRDNTVLASTTAKVDENRHYLWVSEPLSKDVFVADSPYSDTYHISIYVYQGASQSARSLPNRTNRYEISSPYETYRPGYKPPVEIDYTKYGVGTLNPTFRDPFKISSITNPVAVAAGEDHVLVYSKEGNLYGWGKNASHEISKSDYPVLPPTKIGMFKGVKKMGAGKGFSLFLTSSGDLYGWGDLNWLGILKVTSTPERLPFIPEKIKDFDVNEKTVAILTTKGNVYQLGGRYGDADEFYEYHHRQINLGNVTAISMGESTGYAVKEDGTLWTWNIEISTKDPATKKVASGLKDIVILDSSNTGSTGVDYIVAVDKKGELWAWGENHAPLETAAPRVMKQPVKITKNPKRKTENSFGPVGVQVQYTAVAASSNGAMFLTKDKELLLTMYNSGYVPYGLNKKVTSIANNKYNVYWISDGKLWVYGSNNQLGQLGRGVKLK